MTTTSPAPWRNDKEAFGAFSDLIRDFCDHAQKLGQLTGVTLCEFPLDPPQMSTAANPILALIENMESLRAPRHFIALEQHRPRGWGLYWSVPMKKEMAWLQDAPMDVWGRFLRNSEAFFAAYDAKVERRPQEIKDACKSGEEALAAFKSL